MKSTLTVLFGSLIAFAGTVSACPYSDKNQEIAYLQPHQNQESVVEREKAADSNLLVQLQEAKQETQTN